MTAALVVDIWLIPRVAAEHCVLHGAAARAEGLADGAVVAPDTGGCVAFFGCVDIVRHSDRLILDDFHSIRRLRERC
ncbi:MAG: hypothetical protein R2705_01050 [Ilumatobacteraceae bacterium]